MIVIASVLLRVASAIYQGDSVEPLPGTYDQISYHGLAVRVLDGHGFSFAKGWWPATPAGKPTAHWSFLYVLYLIGVYALTGVHPLAARLIQAVLAGILQPWLTFRLGTRLFGERIGLAAAGIAAVYAYFIYYAGSLMTETFYVLCILWALDLATSMAESAGRRVPPLESSLPRVYRIPYRSWLMLGLALGGAVLLRQVFLFVIPVILLFLVWRLLWRSGPSRPSLGRFAKGAMLSLGVIVLMILPWTIRNYRAFDRFVLLNSNAGFAFFWGNHPIHGYYFIPILPGPDPEHPTTGYGELIPKEVRGLDEPAMDAALMKRGLGFILDDPVRYIFLCITRAIEYFKFWPSTESGLVSNIARVASFGLCLPFMLWGMVVSLGGLLNDLRTNRSVRQSDMRDGTLLLIAVAALYSVIHLMTWALVRYRIPVDAIMILFAAVGVVRCYDSLGFRLPRFRRTTIT